MVFADMLSGRPVNVIRKCKCGTTTRTVACRIGSNYANHIWGTSAAAMIECRACKKLGYGYEIFGVVNVSKKCTARCMAATGHDCECECGGKNHGKAHDVEMCVA